MKNIEEGNTIRQENVRVEARDLVLISVRGNYEQPQKFGSLDDLVSGFEIRGFFDPTSGALVRKERVSILMDGTERVYLQVSPITVETVSEPPSVVFQLLEEWEKK